MCVDVFIRHAFIRRVSSSGADTLTRNDNAHLYTNLGYTVVVGIHTIGLYQRLQHLPLFVLTSSCFPLPPWHRHVRCS